MIRRSPIEEGITNLLFPATPAHTASHQHHCGQTDVFKYHAVSCGNVVPLSGERTLRVSAYYYFAVDQTAKSVEITWPSGIMQSFENMNAGTSLRAEEPRS